MRSWVPVPGTTSGRLVEAALELFGAHGFDAVAVTTIASRAGVTTGSLYHHFGHKAGLYNLVRGDVERRVLDRMEGAASLHAVQSVADLAPIVLVGFDYLVTAGYTRLLSDPPQEDGAEDPSPDALEQVFDRLLADSPAIGYLLVAAWRAALVRAGQSAQAADDARAGLVQLLNG